MSPHQLNRKSLIVWYMILSFAFFTYLSVPANATKVSFQEQYQDYTGAIHPYTSDNIATYPLYVIIDNGDTYTVSRIDDSIELIKQNTTYSFENNKISFTLNLTPSVLASRSIQDGANWYINIPKPFTSNRFIWDFKKPNVTNNTEYVIPNNNFWFTNENGQPRLYYNQTARNVGALSTYLKFKFNSYIVSNVTTLGWLTANISFDGARWTDDGSLALNLRNDSAVNMSGLIGYWSMDEREGTIIHNVNNESGIINSTNQGGWFGNTTLNYSTGKIGYSTSFDSDNDYVSIPNSPSLNPSAITISTWFNPTAGTLNSQKSLIQKPFTAHIAPFYQYALFLKDSGINVKSVAMGISVGGALFYKEVDGTGYDYGQWHHLVGTYDGETIFLYLDGKEIGTDATPAGNIDSYNTELWFGAYPNLAPPNPLNDYGGLLDEVHIYGRALNSTEVSVLYNTSMRTRGNVTIWQQNATAGYRVSIARIIVTNTQQNNNTVDLYTKPNSSTTWNLIATNISSNTWYNIGSSYQSASQDFLIAMAGNGSDTPFITSLEWDETLIPAPTSPIPCANAYNDINSAFQLIGILLILFAIIMIIIGVQSYNNPPYIIIGAISGTIGAIMLIIGVFVVITIGSGVGCV